MSPKVPLPPSLEAGILRAYEATRNRLPRVGAVAARPNRRRLASLSRPSSGTATLNLATAVVEAGEAAWRLVAPALEGDRASLHRLRELSRPALLPAGSAGAGPRPGGSRRPEPLPDTPCHGTPEQQRYLLDLIRYVRSTCGFPEALPDDVQVRISRRMTSALGSFRCRGGSRRITISARLFRPGLEDLLWDTVKHELAHLADQVVDGNGRSHGRSWKEWARRLDARPERLCSPREARRIEALRAPQGRPLRYPPEVERWLRSG